MRPIWRFYVGADGRWHWQKMSADREVVGESADSFEDYERCVTSARDAGYAYERAQPRMRWSSSTKELRDQR